MADLMDKMSGIIISQNKKLKEQNQDLKDVKELVKGNKIEPIEESAKADEESPVEDDEEDDDPDLPHLFSLRRSPFYQIKID